MTRGHVGAALLLLVSGCSTEKPASGRAPVREASPPPPGGLRPLTSRDEAKPFDAPGPPSPGTALPPGHPPIDSAPSGQSVTGTVSIAAEVMNRSSPTDVLYLIARSRATKAVVAVRREAGARFPHPFELSSADAMVADQPFVGPFDVTARLSKSGDATPAPGDLEGTTTGVAEGATAVSVVIEKVRQ